MNILTRNHDTSNCENCQIREPGMFCDLPKDGLETFHFARHSSTYPAGTFLYFEREANRGIYVVCSGQVKLSVSSSAGKTLILKIARPGDVLGLSSTLSDTPYEATAEILQTARVTHLRAGEFREIIARHPQTYANVIRQLNLQYESACEQLRTLALCSSTTQKLARLLLLWSDRGRQTPEGAQFTVPLTHEEIAACVGVTRETVTRTLGDFKRKRLIALHGASMVIPNRPALEAASGS